jgi:serine/threonine-protein kinase HipA
LGPAAYIAPGSSLGGARPKANVSAGNGSLWIAKFPSRSDEYNVGAWEMVCHTLAGLSGVRVSESRQEAFSRNGTTFLTRRFDRENGRRLHFASAMTLLGRNDGDNNETGCSYIDLAQFIIRQGANPDSDLEELWKRIVFYIAVSNTDDHLRNHGFILTSRGWILSPAYDVNPNPEGAGLTLNISEEDNTLDYGLALSVAPLFRLNSERANDILHAIRKSVARWRNIATKLKISSREIDEMAPAFRG